MTEGALPDMSLLFVRSRLSFRFLFFLLKEKEEKRKPRPQRKRGWEQKISCDRSRLSLPPFLSRKKRSPFGTHSVRKVYQCFYISPLSDCRCYNPTLAIPVDPVTHALYYLFITPLYQVGTGFVILSYQLNTSFACFIIT